MRRRRLQAGNSRKTPTTRSGRRAREEQRGTTLSNKPGGARRADSLAGDPEENTIVVASPPNDPLPVRSAPIWPRIVIDRAPAPAPRAADLRADQLESRWGYRHPDPAILCLAIRMRRAGRRESGSSLRRAARRCASSAQGTAADKADDLSCSGQCRTGGTARPGDAQLLGSANCLSRSIAALTCVRKRLTAGCTDGSAA
jgi:hypothetical protein